MNKALSRALGAALTAAMVTVWPATARAWEPTKTVELIVPAGIGGGAGQMAQLIQGIVTKYKLMPTSMVVISKKGGSGAEGFLYVKNAKGDPHKLIITLSNLFTTPLATGSPFSWTDYTPIAMMALDEFVLWVNAKTPYKTPTQYIDAVKKDPKQVQDGRHRLEAGRPDHHRGDRAADGREVHLRAVPRRRRRSAPSWSAGTSTPRSTIRSSASRIGARAPCGRFACSTPSPCPIPTRSPATMSWEHIPPCKSSGLDIEYTDAARHHDRAGRVEGRGRLLRRRCSKRSARTPEWKRVHEERRLQPELHDRRRIPSLARGRGQAASRPDGKGRLPAQVIV